MEIQLEETEHNGIFYIEVDGKREGQLYFTKAYNDRIIINHTEVSEVLKGKNAGKQLVASAVDYARKKHLKVVPLCPFARSVFDRVKEYADVL